MWPWEHLVVAYVLYSLLAHVVLRRSPTTRETIAVAVGSQLPDLIDKPLAWTFEITEGGYAIGHSILVVPIVCLAVLAAAGHYGAERSVAGAFSTAIGSHLVADIVNPVRLGRPPELRVILWPVATPPAYDRGSFLDHFVAYFVRYADQLLGNGLSTQIVVQLGIGVGVVALWFYDGAPIVSDCWRAVRSRLH